MSINIAEVAATLRGGDDYFVTTASGDIGRVVSNRSDAAVEGATALPVLYGDGTTRMIKVTDLRPQQAADYFGRFATPRGCGLWVGLFE